MPRCFPIRMSRKLTWFSANTISEFLCLPPWTRYMTHLTFSFFLVQVFLCSFWSFLEESYLHFGRHLLRFGRALGLFSYGDQIARWWRNETWWFITEIRFVCSYSSVLHWCRYKGSCIRHNSCLMKFNELQELTRMPTILLLSWSQFRSWAVISWYAWCSSIDLYGSIKYYSV